MSRPVGIDPGASGTVNVTERDDIADVFRADCSTLRWLDRVAGDQIGGTTSEDVTQRCEHSERETFRNLGDETVDLRRREMHTSFGEQWCQLRGFPQAMLSHPLT